MYKAEVKNQLNRKIKVVRFDGGNEYYNRYNKSDCNPGSFIKFLEQHNIVARYIMSENPQQKSMAKRRNHILMDIMRSMIGNFLLPLNL